MKRRVFLKAAGFAVLSAGLALALFACPHPVNYEGSSGEGSGKSGGGDGLGLDIGVGNVEDKVPELIWSVDGGTTWTQPLAEGDPVSVYLTSTPDSGVMAVANAVNYDSGTIKWYCNNNDTPFFVGDEIPVTAGSSPFGMAANYRLAVLGEIGGTPYSILVIIVVGP